ncbi:MAG: GTP-binding protein [Lachnospiraceae bacterium]|nr:GTP-binding protein [Lachnospiraceae bacterium]
MTKIDIFSGFLGAGKTTLIKKLIAEAYHGEQLVLIENEFGEIAIDGGFLLESGIKINEMNSGCICCSLVGDFRKALTEVIETYHPDRILIEPSGVGKLSDVIRAVQKVQTDEVVLNTFTTVADASKCKVYMKNFGEFYNDQVEHANCIVLSRTGGISQEKLDACVALLREHNTVATIITTPWEEITGAQILEAMEHADTLEEELKALAAETEEEHHHHHHHDEDEEHEHEHEHHHHHHDDDDEEDEHEHEHHHHHHDDDDEEDEHEHEHHHHHHDDDDDEDEHHHHHHHHDDDEECDDPECSCHHHHHHHDADEIFGSWGVETTKKFTKEEIADALAQLGDSEKYGQILRAKGIVAGTDGQWIHFDYVPEETNIRNGNAIVMGRLCVIGAHIKEKAIKELWQI